MTDNIVTRLRAGTKHDPCVWLGQFGAGPCVRCEAADEIERLRDELSEDEVLRNRMSDILHATANALHGGPLENGLWSWHDLPDRAERLVSAVNTFALDQGRHSQ